MRCTFVAPSVMFPGVSTAHIAVSGLESGPFPGCSFLPFHAEPESRCLACMWDTSPVLRHGLSSCPSVSSSHPWQLRREKHCWGERVGAGWWDFSTFRFPSVSMPFAYCFYRCISFSRVTKRNGEREGGVLHHLNTPIWAQRLGQAAVRSPELHSCHFGESEARVVGFAASPGT